MCNCILELVQRGFVERETTYQDEDFKEKGFQVRSYRRTGVKSVVDTGRVFRLNYCPACGKKLPKFD